MSSQRVDRCREGCPPRSVLKHTRVGEADSGGGDRLRPFRAGAARRAMNPPGRIYSYRLPFTRIRSWLSRNSGG